MRVLMFGWEFPPHISGGLGTACYGMTRALADRGADVCFVLPKLTPGDDGNNFLKLRSASGTPITSSIMQKMSWAGQEIWDANIRFKAITSPLTPYMTPESYLKTLKELSGRSIAGGEGESHVGESSFTWDLQGGYGANLLSLILN